MDDEKTKRLRERALGHPMRKAMLDLLEGEELTPHEMRSRLPDEPSLSRVNYHLLVLREAEMVDCVGGLYRLA